MSTFQHLLSIVCSIVHHTYGFHNAYLTVGRMNDNGAVVNNWSSQASNGNWLLTDSSSGYHLRIYSDNRFAMSSTEVSTLKLEIGSDDSPTMNDQLIVTFSQNNIKYITTLLQLSANKDHQIYPQCTSSMRCQSTPSAHHIFINICSIMLSRIC